MGKERNNNKRGTGKVPNEGIYVLQKIERVQKTKERKCQKSHFMTVTLYLNITLKT